MKNMGLPKVNLGIITLGTCLREMQCRYVGVSGTEIMWLLHVSVNDALSRMY